MRTALICVAALFILGCNQPQQTGEPAQKSAAQDTIDAMTQKTSVDAGRRAAETLRKVGAQEKKDYEEAAGQ